MPQYDVSPLQKTSDSLLFNPGSESAQDKPYLYAFYHIPKCGGMDFYGTLVEAFYFKRNELGKPVLFGRKDAYIEDHENFAIPDNPRLCGIFASHLGRDFLEEILSGVEAVRNITFLRDPYKRALSAYTYQCMREDRKPTRSGFEEFIQQPDNINAICKSLDKNYNTLDDIIAFIRSFYVCTTLDRQQALLTHLLKLHGLPNSAREKLNETMDQYRMDELYDDDSLIEQFNTLNQDDIQLYGYVVANPIEPELVESEGISETTILTNAIQTPEAMKTKTRLVSTRNLLIIANAMPQPTSRISEFMQWAQSNGY